jgi:hypothetical protein
LLVVASPANALGSLTWAKLAPLTHPSARWWQAQAYDSANQKLVLFGGFNNPTHNAGTFFSDTWLWNGTTWTNANPAHHPSGRDGAAMAYDATSGKVILFGGFDGSTQQADTWAWNGTDWTQLAPQHSPSARGWSALDRDVNGQLILFGGYNGNGLSDTWQWNGADWIQLNPATVPTPRADHAMAYDAAHGKLVMFGGGNWVSTNYVSQYGDTWTWNGTDWTHASTVGPHARSDVYMTYDAPLGRVVMFGGYDNDASSASASDFQDTWSWTGTAWGTLAPLAKPSKRDSGAMTYFPPTGKTVLFGGYDAVAWAGNLDAGEADTWVLSFATAVSGPAISTVSSATTSFVVSWGAPGVVSSYVVQYARRVKNSSGVWVTSAWSNWKTVAGTVHSATFAGAQGNTYLFHAKAVYVAGATGYSPAVTTVVPYDDRAGAAVFSTGWTRATSSGRYLGTTTYATTASKTMTFRTDALSFSLIGDKCATCGQMRVYIDGVLAATVDTYRSATAARQILYTKTFTATKLHTLKILTLGTAGRPKVILDAVSVKR